MKSEHFKKKKETEDHVIILFLYIGRDYKGQMLAPGTLLPKGTATKTSGNSNKPRKKIENCSWES